MSVLVEKFSMIALLVIGLSLLEGNHADNEKSVHALDIQQAPTAAKDELKLTVERSRMMELEGQLHINIQRSKDTKHEQRLQTRLTETERTRVENQLQSYVIRKHHLLNDIYAIQTPNLNAQLAIDAKKRKNIIFTPQRPTPGEKRQKVRLGSQIWIELRKTWEPKENPVPSLWKRARGQFSGTQKPKKSLLKTESQKKSDSLSKGKVNAHLASNIPVPVKHKNKLKQVFSHHFSKTKKQLSENKERVNSKIEGLSKRLTSGHAKKPSGVGQFSEYEPSLAAMRSQLTQSSKPDEPGDGLPYERPAESLEIKELWDFINHHSKQWSSYRESPSFSYKKTPTPAMTKQIDSLSPTRIADAHHNVNRFVSPSKRQTPSSQPERVVSRNAGARVSESDADKDVRHLIKRQRKGWDSSQGVPDTDTANSSDDESSRKPQSPVPSSHQRIAPSNSEKLPKQLSNKELGNQYDAYIGRVRSRERLGSNNSAQVETTTKK